MNAVKKIFCRWFVNIFITPSLKCYSIRWKKEDMDALHSFLQSKSGQKFQHIALAYIQESDRQAVSVGTPHACGSAAGKRLLLALIQFYSVNVPPHEDESEQEDQQGALFHPSPFPESSVRNSLTGNNYE